VRTALIRQECPVPTRMAPHLPLPFVDRRLDVFGSDVRKRFFALRSRIDPRLERFRAAGLQPSEDWIEDGFNCRFTVGPFESRLYLIEKSLRQKLRDEGASRLPDSL